jgi:hypothetical protein
VVDGCGDRGEDHLGGGGVGAGGEDVGSGGGMRVKISAVCSEDLP